MVNVMPGARPTFAWYFSGSSVTITIFAAPSAAADA
jgi:hypothetical protein